VIKAFEQGFSNLSKDPEARFTCAQGFKLVSWFLESKTWKSQINHPFANGLGHSLFVGYSCMYTLENLLRSLNLSHPYLGWFEGQVDSDDGKN